MKKIFPLILLTFFSLNLLASTDISEGSVSGIWTFDESPYYVLGNINIEAGEILTIEPGVDIIFSDSTTMESEGTIIAQGTIDNIITFKSNETWKGIDIGSLQPDTPPSVFEYCHFTDIHNESGGSIKLSFVDYISFHNCKFNSNIAHKGGAIKASSGQIDLHKCEFLNNEAYQSGDNSPCGGALYFNDIYATITNCNFQRNLGITEQGTAGLIGGAIYLSNSDVTIINSKFFANKAADGYSIKAYQSSLKLINCTLTNNLGFIGSGNISLLSNCYASFLNSIFWENNNNEIFSFPNQNNVVDVDYCTVQDGEASFYLNTGNQLNWNQGNLWSNPHLVNRVVGDYRLEINSPCINEGRPDTTGLNLPATCYYGNSRVLYNRIDMGCFEFELTDSEDNVLDYPTKEILNIYPNPLNLSETSNERDRVSTIEIQTFGAENAILEIRNLKGQRIYSNVLSPEKDIQSIHWDGVDMFDKAVSSGIYFINLKIDNQIVSSKRCLVLK